jgi:hypothetical protein
MKQRTDPKNLIIGITIISIVGLAGIYILKNFSLSRFFSRFTFTIEIDNISILRDNDFKVVGGKIDFVGIFSSHTEVYIEDIYAFMKIARKYDIEVMIWDDDYVKFLVGDKVVYYTDRIFYEFD